jgi:hypothetical protein
MSISLHRFSGTGCYFIWILPRKSPPVLSKLRIVDRYIDEGYDMTRVYVRNIFVLRSDVAEKHPVIRKYRRSRGQVQRLARSIAPMFRAEESAGIMRQHVVPDAADTWLKK